MFENGKEQLSQIYSTVSVNLSGEVYEAFTSWIFTSYMCRGIEIYFREEEIEVL
jgi:hypothetical protein